MFPIIKTLIFIALLALPSHSIPLTENQLQSLENLTAPPSAHAVLPIPLRREIETSTTPSVVTTGATQIQDNAAPPFPTSGKGRPGSHPSDVKRGVPESVAPGVDGATIGSQEHQQQRRNWTRRRRAHP